MTLVHCAIIGFAITLFWSVPIVGICSDKTTKRKTKLALVGVIFGTFLAVTFGAYILGVLK